MSWAAVGKWIGKGVVWLVRNPEALNTAVKVIKDAKKKEKKADQ